MPKDPGDESNEAPGIRPIPELLGEPASKLEKAIRDRGDTPVFEEPDRELPDDGGSYIQKKLGLCAALEIDGTIGTLFFYSAGHHGFSQFAEALPHELSFAFSQSKAREILGEPNRSGGPVRSLIPGDLIYWDRWDYGRSSIHCEYPEDRESIRMITLMAHPPA